MAGFLPCHIIEEILSVFEIKIIAKVSALICSSISAGDYVLVERIVEGKRVQAEILRVLNAEQMEYIRKRGLWPVAFSAQPAAKHTDDTDYLPPRVESDASASDSADESNE